MLRNKSMCINFLLTKKRIKYNLEKLVNFISSDLIDDTCTTDWQTSVQTKKRDIIIFGVISFDFRYQRPQELAARLAKLGHRVFYIEHEFFPTRNYTKETLINVKKKDKNLYTVKLSADRNYFIYAERMSEKGLLVLNQSIKKLLKLAKIKNPQIIIHHPFWYDTLNILSGHQIIYECFDEHSGFKQSGKWIKKQEEALVKTSDAIIVSSQKLLEKFSGLRKKNVFLISNGASTKQLLEIKKPNKPVLIKNIQKPIIGYHGAIEEWIDDKLIAAILKNYPQYDLVMIGAINNLKIAKLKNKYSNLHLVGEINFKEVFDYVYYFDLAIIPFSITPLIENTLPVKFFEYLALKKPILTTALPELIKYKEICFYTESREEFIEKIPKAIEKQLNTKLNKKIEQICLNEDWQNKAIVYDRLLEKIR